MTFRPSRFAAVSAMVAALSMTAAPAAAVELPVSVAPVGTPVHAEVLPVGAGEANQWRRYRPYRHHRHRDRGVDAGDVIAGVAVVGVLAAILSSSNRNRERYEERRERVRYDDRRDRFDSRGIESAVDMCLDQVEYRDNRVENVDRADRDTSGWTVSGALETGERWTCFIDNGGEVRSIDYGTSVSYSAQAPSDSATGQLSDATYTRARATTRTAADQPYSYDDAAAIEVPAADDPRPAYPGGPLPGEEGYDEDWQAEEGDIDESEWEGDGRYTTAQAPDFEQGGR